jgi:hypothetical protein
MRLLKLDRMDPETIRFTEPGEPPSETGWTITAVIGLVAAGIAIAALC